MNISLQYYGLFVVLVLSIFAIGFFAGMDHCHSQNLIKAITG